MALSALKRLVMLMADGGSISGGSPRGDGVEDSDDEALWDDGVDDGVDPNYWARGHEDSDSGADTEGSIDDGEWGGVAAGDRHWGPPPPDEYDYYVHPDDEVVDEPLDFSEPFAEAAQTLNEEHIHGGMTFAVDGGSLVASLNGEKVASWFVRTDGMGRQMLMCDWDPSHEQFNGMVYAGRVVRSVKVFLNLFVSNGIQAWVDAMMAWLGEGFELVHVRAEEWEADVRCVGGRALTVSPCWSWTCSYKVKVRDHYNKYNDDEEFRADLLARRPGGLSMQDLNLGDGGDWPAGGI